LTRLGIGAFTMLLVAVLLLMLGGLLATDGILQDTADAHASTDAEHVAARIQHQVDSRLEGLSIFDGLGGARDGPQAVSERQVLAEAYAASHTACLGVAVTDSSGGIVHLESFDPAAAGMTNSALSAAIEERTGDSATVRLRVVPRADNPSARLLLITRRPGGKPVSRRSAVAVFDLGRLFTELPVGPSERRTLAVTAGAATLWSQGPVHGRIEPASGAAVAQLPGGTEWTVRVTHAAGVGGLRRSLWSLGVLTVLLLGLGVIRERRQAMRVAERSAELERLSSELLRANRMKSEFLANVSHELRTPLNAIVGFVELLKDGVYGDLSPRQVGPVDRIAVSATHLRHLVDQVLDIAKIAAGRLEVHMEAVPLRNFVLNVASELESLFSERGLSFSISVPAVMPRVRTDPTHLRQILVNLIGNAVKHTPSGGVAIRARMFGTAARGRRGTPDDPGLALRAPDRHRPWVALQVVDTGVGIAVADHERIFDEFEQVNAGPRGESIERGTGLGLAISRRLARLIGGDITVDSQPGKGSTFTVWLPLDPSDASSTTVPSSSGAED
jgi:signal transduction histidine kinase